MEVIKGIEKETEEYIGINQLQDVEKDAIRVFVKLLKPFFWKIVSNSLLFESRNIEEEVIKSKNQIIQYLKDKNYNPCEFQILKVETFDDHLEYISGLLKNLCFHLNNYEFKKIYLNFYYYIFHLIYFILLAIIKTKDKNLMKDKIIKFYFFHIIHFFQDDKKAPEKYFFFYHGAYKLLKKRFAIPVDFVIDLDVKQFQLTMNDTIETMFSEFKCKLSFMKDEYKNTKVLDFIAEYTNIFKEVCDITNNIKLIKTELFVQKTNIEGRTGNEKLVLYFKQVHDSIKKIINIIGKYDLKCQSLIQYNELLKNFQKLISPSRITLNHLILMEMDYNCQFQGVYDIEKYIKYAELFNKCDKDSEQDYSDVFMEILNSNKFKNLYLKAMNSSYINNFVQENNLNDEYDTFIKNYSKDFNKYVLCAPLTRGIKAYVSNYLRIALNINSINLFGDLNEEERNEFLSSYLLIHLLHESFHFIFRLGKIGVLANKAISPNRKKIKEEYSEMGVDLILYLFGTEYITFISKDNSSLLCNPKSWENTNTNFKVFQKIYLNNNSLSGGEDQDKNAGSGLKCNITDIIEINSNEKVFMPCTEGAIKYCF